MERRWEIALGLAAGGLGALLGATWVRRRLFDREVDAEIRALLDEVAPRPTEAITDADLEGLPEPAARYLRFAGVVGRRPIQNARVLQSGRLRGAPDEAWMPFEAVEYYSAAPPGFVWFADARRAPLLSVRVRDLYVAGRGAILGKLAGAFPVVDRSGPAIDQGAALRFLNEMVFFPTAFLEDYVHWDAIDDRAARVTMNHWSGDVSAICYIDSQGRMVDFVAERYRDEPGGPRLREWRTPFDEWARVDGFRVPVSGTGVWQIGTSSFDYIDIDIESITYDIAPDRPKLIEV